MALDINKLIVYHSNNIVLRNKWLY